MNEANVIAQEPVAVTPVSSPEPSSDEALGAIWDKFQAEGVSDDEPAPVADSEAEPGPVRDDKGRFVAKQASAGASPPETPEGAEDEAPALSGQAAPPALPANWRPDMADLWNKLEPGDRDRMGKWSQEVHTRMSDMGRKISGYSEVQSVMDDMVQTYHERFQGPDAMRPVDAIKFLYSVQKDMDARPVETLLEIAARYDAIPALAKALGLNGQGDSSAALQRTIQQLESRLAGMVSPDHINTQISRAMTERETAQAVERFKSEKPFYADVEPVLPQFIDIAWSQKPDANALEALATAYDMAVNAIPAVREKALAAASKAAAPKPDPLRAAAAKKAASINVTSTSSGKVKPRSEEDAMSETWDRLMAS